MSEDCFEVDCTSDAPHYLLTLGHHILKDVNLKKNQKNQVVIDNETRKINFEI